jgi:predicted transcriptional regulator
MKRKSVDPIAKELDAIKRLLVLQLITSGVQSNDVARTLGVSNSVVSGLVPARSLKKKNAR